MKRSDMIEVLVERFRDSAYLDISKVEANIILECLENAGMQPPGHLKPIPFENGIQYPLVPGDLKNDAGIWCTPGYFGWEPEDETK